ILKKIMNPEEKSNFIGFKIPSYRDGRKIRPSSPERYDGFTAETSKNPRELAVVPSLHRWLKCAGKE
ncbi:Hypothetical predicted protein, partial [Paramuricea clavata]